jgi:membrane protease YdiL (CAAX protease family)
MSWTVDLSGNLLNFLLEQIEQRRTMYTTSSNVTATTKRTAGKLIQPFPVIVYLLIAFGWSWLFWIAAIPFREQNDLLVMAMVFIGGYGPAIGGILTLGLHRGQVFDLSRKRLVVWVLAAAGIFALMAARYLVGPVSGFDPLPADLTLSLPIILATVTACLVGGWVISSAVSENPDIRSRMASLLPVHLPVRWAVFAFTFFAGLLFASWGIAALFGLDVEVPALWGRPVLEVVPLLILSFTLTAVARGGLEEPGWRGVLQPALQKKFSPFAAALIVSIFWSLWHLPLYLNGFYGGDLLGGMLGGGIYRILLAILLAWFYNRSGGNLFLLVFLHTSFNELVNFIPISDFVVLLLWLLVVGVIVVKDKMFRKLNQASLPGGQQSGAGA